MESRWNKIGEYPAVSYTNGKGNVLHTQFFEGSGQVFVTFSNPSKELVGICDLYCEKERGKDSGEVTAIVLKGDLMGHAQYPKFVIDAVLEDNKFDDKTKQEIKASVNGFFANNRTYNDKRGIGLNDPVPMTPRLQAQLDQIRELEKPWYRRK